MVKLRLVAAGAIAIVMGACADTGTVAGPQPASQVQTRAAAASHQIAASGSYDALVDFSTITLTPRGQQCEITVKGQLVFTTGTLHGVAPGQTTALEFATCDEVAANPPGTFPDVFHSELVFDGTADGNPAHADVRYMGRSEPGGHINGRLVFSNGIAGQVDADAFIAVGGTYDGSLVVP